SREPVAISQTDGTEPVRPLLALPSDVRISFDSVQNGSQTRWSRVRTADAALQKHLAELANLLETRSFASVPFVPKEKAQGRLYILTSSRTFSHAETEFLAQAAAQMAAAV